MRVFSVVSASFSPVAHAATVAAVEGEVLVNSGSGFKPITGALSGVKPGTEVMVRPGGAATITYASNCSVRVPSGVWAVQATAPCAGKETIDFTTRMNQEAPPAGDAPAAAGDYTPWIIGGLVVAGAAGAAVLLSQGNNHNAPASP
jgi:hypothetical protein